MAFEYAAIVACDLVLDFASEIRCTSVRIGIANVLGGIHPTDAPVFIAVPVKPVLILGSQSGVRGV